MWSVLLLAAALAPTGSPATAARPVELRGSVSAIVDGDTIRVVSRGFETPVRLLGIDTPETRGPGVRPQCWGPEASVRTARILHVGRPVRLITDPTQDTRDRYARLLAYVYLPGHRLSVNYALVATGYARAYVYDHAHPGVHAASYLRAEARARRARRGLWGPPCNGRTTAPSPARAPAAPGCEPGYTGACVPIYPPDVDCDDIRARVRVVGADPHRLDGNGDGWGCERYG